MAGIPSYVLVGELALCKVLSGVLPRPGFAAALAESAPPRWRQLASMALRTAAAHADRGDAVATVANLGEATIAEAQARLAERRQWALNEKGIVAKAGLSSVAEPLASAGLTPARLQDTVSSVARLLDVSHLR